MKKLFKIILVTHQINKLRRKREEQLLRISIKYPEAARVDNLEDVMPNYFMEVDRMIAARERLLTLLYRR